MLCRGRRQRSRSHCALRTRAVPADQVHPLEPASCSVLLRKKRSLQSSRLARSLVPRNRSTSAAAAFQSIVAIFSLSFCVSQAAVIAGASAQILLLDARPLSRARVLNVTARASGKLPHYCSGEPPSPAGRRCSFARLRRCTLLSCRSACLTCIPLGLRSGCFRRRLLRGLSG